MRRLIVCSLLLVLAVSSAPAAAQSIWTPVATPNTEEIAAIEYRDAFLRYATSSGKIFRRQGDGTFAQEFTVPGRQFHELEFNPSGTVGLAGADNGKLYRFNGSWSEVSLANDTWGHECFGPNPPPSGTPAGNVVGIAWSSDTTAWLVTGEYGLVLRSTDGGQSWIDVNRQGNGTCEINDEFTDVITVPGSATELYLVSETFATLYRTADAFTTPAVKRSSLVNCFGIRMVAAIDPATPSRISALGPCEGTLHWGFSADSGQNKNYTNSGGAKLYDIAAGPGYFLAAGDTGQIESTHDGTTVYSLPAGGAQATTNWRAIDVASGTRAVVGGAGGALALTEAANTIPDTTPPTGLIAGPESIAAGQPVTLTAQVADNEGGSGIDPGGFAWSSDGLPGATGPTATFTFPNPGTYSVRLVFRDNAGNTAEAFKSILVTGAAAPPSVTFPTDPASQPTAKREGKFIRIRVKGRLTVPPGKSCAGRLRIRVKRKKKVIALRHTNVRSDCSYRRKVSLRRSKLKKVKRVKVILQFLPAEGSDLAKTRVVYQTKIR